MEVYEAIKTRKSVRAFLDKPVEKEKLDRIMEAGRLAPSASNRQEWRFVVVQDEETRTKLIDAANNQRFVGEATVVIACCAETEGHVMPCGHESFGIDVAIAIDHITLAAAAEGLGTCWIGAFSPQKVRKVLGIPENIQVVELLPLGYPKDPSAISKNRKSTEEIVRYEKW